MNSLKIKGSGLNSYFSARVSQDRGKVKQNFSVDDAEYLRLADMDRDAFNRVVDKYTKVLETIYDTSDYDAFMRIVAEEMLADAYAGINAFGFHAEQFGDTVNKWMDEHFMGKKSEAEMEQLRGPPEGQRFSVDDSSFENAEEAEKAKSIIQQLNDNLGRIMQMDTVAEVDATNAIPFTGNYDNDTAVAAELFNKQGRVASRAGFGNVMLTTKGAGESISHGNGAAKQYAFVAVKNVIESGIEIFSDPNHKGKNYDTVTFAAPIDFFGKKIGMAVVVKKYHQGNDINFYIHEICDSEGNFVKFNDDKKMTAQTTSDPNPTAGAAKENILPIDTIARTAREVKQNFSVDDAEYLRLAENPAQNYDRLNKMVRQAAEDAGYNHLFFHAAKNGGYASDTLSMIADFMCRLGEQNMRDFHVDFQMEK